MVWANRISTRGKVADFFLLSQSKQCFVLSSNRINTKRLIAIARVNVIRVTSSSSCPSSNVSLNSVHGGIVNVIFSSFRGGGGGGKMASELSLPSQRHNNATVPYTKP